MHVQGHKPKDCRGPHVRLLNSPTARIATARAYPVHRESAASQCCSLPGGAMSGDRIRLITQSVWVKWVFVLAVAGADIAIWYHATRTSY